MPDHHVKGQPAASMFVREKGCVKCYTFRDTPCSMANNGWTPLHNAAVWGHTNVVPLLLMQEHNLICQ